MKSHEKEKAEECVRHTINIPEETPKESEMQNENSLAWLGMKWFDYFSS